jgi:hypothetical protein
MKQAKLAITLELEISYPDAFDDDWVCEQYYSSPRCGVYEFEGEMLASSVTKSVNLVRGPDVATSPSVRTAELSWAARLLRRLGL